MKEKKGKVKTSSVSKPPKQVKEVVKSIIENTTPLPAKGAPKVADHGLIKYYSSTKLMSEELKKIAVTMAPTNLLTAKMALFGAVELVQKMIEERKQ